MCKLKLKLTKDQICGSSIDIRTRDINPKWHAFAQEVNIPGWGISTVIVVESVTLNNVRN